MQIFISGCAKTRTTLIQWLFTAFENCIVFPGELHINVFRLSNIRYSKNFHLVIKRTIGSILSHALPEDEFKDQVARVQMDKIKLVRVIRNKEDTLKSGNGYVSPERYENCEQQAETLRSLITAEINSDNVLANPDYEQDKIAEALGLKIAHRWSNWPDFAPQTQMQYIRYPKIFNRLGGAK